MKSLGPGGLHARRTAYILCAVYVCLADGFCFEARPKVCECVQLGPPPLPAVREPLCAGKPLYLRGKKGGRARGLNSLNSWVCGKRGKGWTTCEKGFEKGVSLKEDVLMISDEVVPPPSPLPPF